MCYDIDGSAIDLRKSRSRNEYHTVSYELVAWAPGPLLGWPGVEANEIVDLKCSGLALEYLISWKTQHIMIKELERSYFYPMQTLCYN